MGILEWLSSPWPWYVAGPLVGVTVPLLLWLGNRSFGVSDNLRHVCAIFPSRLQFFRYDWRSSGRWNLAFAVGIVVGGFIASYLFANPEPLRVAASTERDLAAIGIGVNGELGPDPLFSLAALGSIKSWAILLAGGFLVGFGARYAGGCTSGHAITGLANLQLPSLVAVVGFFVGGLIMTHFILPFLF